MYVRARVCAIDPQTTYIYDLKLHNVQACVICIIFKDSSMYYIPSLFHLFVDTHVHVDSPNSQYYCRWNAMFVLHA